MLDKIFPKFVNLINAKIRLQIVLKEFLPLVQEYKLVNFSMVIQERSLLLIQECSIQVNTMKSQLAIHIV